MWFKKDITGKHVFLTGAGSGLGRELSVRLAKKGAVLSLVDINLDGLEETKRLVIEARSDAKVHIAKLDVTNREQIKQVTKEARAKFGFCDIVVNNAGIMQVGPTEKADEKLAETVM